MLKERTEESGNNGVARFNICDGAKVLRPEAKRAQVNSPHRKVMWSCRNEKDKNTSLA